jgi:hypothetical protein
MAGDFNNDGKPDYALSDGRVWLNTLQPILVSPKSISLVARTLPVAVTVSPGAGVTATSNQPWLTYANGHVSGDATGLAPGVYQGKISFGGTGLFGAVVRVTFTVPPPSWALNLTASSPLAATGTYYQGDFNGDGKLDLLVYDGTTARVWFGDGTANFTPAAQTLTLPIYSSIAVADFDLDGHLDIVAVAQYGSPIQVYFGDGIGGFTGGPTTPFPPYPYPLGDPTPTVADFNLDGIPDLLVQGIVFLGDGKGSFREVVPSVEPGMTGSVVVADFNGDGIPDVAYTSIASSFVDVWLGDGKGGLKLWQRYDFAIGDPALGILTSGDFNNDGALDLAITSGQHPGRIEFLYGNGRGTFSRGLSLELPGSNRINAIAAADFNGDGNVDLAASTAVGTTILFGDGKGHFTASVGTYPITSGTVVSDFNGDGRPDMAGNAANGLQVLLGGLALPTLTLTQVPPSPFDIGQTVSLTARVIQDPHAFTTAINGQITLSDGAASISTKPLTNTTAYFVTPYVPGTHNFTASYSGDPENAPASVSLKLIETGAPVAIQALSNAFPLQALVSDANGNPVPGVRVSFSAPESGPSGLFAGSISAAVLTDSRGVATAPPFVPNGVPGSFSLTATTTIGGFTCVFSESN